MKEHAAEATVRGPEAPTTLRQPEPATETETERIVTLQRLAGNRAVARILLQRSGPPDPPTGVTLGSDPLPAGANTASASSATITADVSVTGGWADAGGSTLASGAVGNVDRILLEDVPGTSQRDRATGFADATSAAGGARAVAIVPRSLRGASAGEVVVIVHFHGLGKGMRSRSGTPTDVGDYQMEQQVDAFVSAHPGARIVALLPIGVTFGNPGAQSVTYGAMNIDTFIGSCFAKLRAAPAAAGQVAALPQGATPGTVYLSAHSGGGLPLGQMLAASLTAAGSSQLPVRFGGVFGFESFHGDVGTWQAFLSAKLDQALTRLETINAAGGAATDITRDQLAYLRGADSFRFIVLGGFGGYATRAGMVRDTLLGWWKRRGARLATATGSDATVLNQLWSNFQAETFTGSTHVNALSVHNNIGRALASLPIVGPLAPVLPPPTGGAGSGSGGAGSGSGGAGSGSGGAGGGAPQADAGTNMTPADAGVARMALRMPDTETETEIGTASRAAASLAERVLARWTTQNYDLSTNLATIVKANDKKKMSKVEEAPATYCANILTNAGINASTWYSSFTTATFLGIPIGDPIHTDLADHLKAVETTFAGKYGGSTNSAAEAGKTLGITSIGGSRKYPTSAVLSMHLFGLAIDVNYTANPFISDSANPVFQRAAGLLGQTTTGFQNNMSYSDLSGLDKLVTDYFALIDASDDIVQAKLDSATAAPWKGATPANARKLIQADLDFVAARWERTSATQKAIIKAGGFMDLDQRFVADIGLNWGASYGDIMHFDMRNKGNGAKIQAAVQAYKTTKETESKTQWAKAHPSP